MRSLSILGLLFAAMAALALVGCDDDDGGPARPTETAPPFETPATLVGTPPSGTAGPAGEVAAAFAAQFDLSTRLDRPLENVQVVSIEERDWPDACLGLAEENEICAQVITPGYEVVLEVDGDSYVYRTDTMINVRLDEGASAD